MRLVEAGWWGATPTEQHPTPHHACGSAQGNARLNEHEVAQARRMPALGFSPGAIARAFNVSADAIYDVAHGRTCRWLTDEDIPDTKAA